jgi:radical SAM-linked protein
MAREKVRIRFRKAGDLRLVSHHDLMRTFERMLRRADLPVHSTSGFNPKPRLVFALSLGLGIVGCREVLELELDAPVLPEEVQERLQRQAPAGLDILEVRSIDPKASAQVQRVTYRITMPAERIPDLRARTTALLAASEIPVQRLRPQPRRLDIRPYLMDLRALPDFLELELRVTPTGTARPDELLELLGLGDLLPSGSILERTALELHDEQENTVPASEQATAPGSLPRHAPANPLVLPLKGNA